ncbi:MAG TPA: ABC transporter substrate-binding protein, partial [Firmicutes bacterium]|nr:ABC transporter substrate-binding protein [Bacillota bacterium]
MKRFVAIVLLGVLLVSAAAYGENKTYVLRTSTNTAQNSTIGEALAYFATQVNAKSKKRINVTVNYGSELGSQSEQVEMATTGSLDMVVAAPGTGLGVWVPQLVMFEFPYLFKDNAQYRRVLKGMTPEVSRLVASYGFTAASGQSQGARDMLTIKPVKSLQDMKGLKMRGPNSIYLTMFNDLGAAGTTTDWNDIYTALQTKVIDGMESSPSAINSMKFNEVAPNLTVTNHIIACTYYFFSTKWLNSLPKDLRKVVLDCANDAAVYQAKIDDKDEAKSLSEMQAQGLKVWKLHDTDKWVKACSGMLAQYRA